MTRSRRAVLALLLLVPAPTIGTVSAMLVPGLAGMPLGQSIYAVSKVWLLLLPLLWWLLIAAREPRLERLHVGDAPRGMSGFAVGAWLGVAMSVVILAGYALIGRHLVDPADFRAAAARSGLDDPIRYLVLAIYICAVNALLEEIVWRWFVFRRVEEILPRGHGGIAIVVSGILFTIHHVFALAAQVGPAATVLGSFGVLVGGVVWSWCYLRYRSVWPGYVSHAIVDVAIFALGAWMLFGG